MLAVCSREVVIDAHAVRAGARIQDIRPPRLALTTSAGAVKEECESGMLAVAVSVSRRRARACGRAKCDSLESVNAAGMPASIAGSTIFSSFA